MQFLRHSQSLKRIALLALVSFFGSGAFVFAFLYSAVLIPSSLEGSVLSDAISALAAAALTAVLFSHALVALAGRYAYWSSLVIPGGLAFFVRWFELRSLFICAVLAATMLFGIWLAKQRSNIAVKRDAPPASRLRAPYL